MILFIVRHAESTANNREILASQQDFPLSEKGHRQAGTIAKKFFSENKLLIPDVIFASPLTRAKETASYFSAICGAEIVTAVELIEQHLGRFSGMTYKELESESEYCHEKTKRWNWIPDGGGESYEMVAERLIPFFRNLENRDYENVLIVTHAVTMRMIHAIITDSMPSYPENIARNGEIWKVSFTKTGSRHLIEVLDYSGVLATEWKE
ncbi:MAG: histidine phosphatase family protein [Spirochaetes bacterium]|nr:histidine phosphatase family protein [Spirochaetota bacterium]